MSVLGDIRAGVMASLSSLTVNGDGYLMTTIQAPCFEVDFPDQSFLYNRTHGRKTNELNLVVRGIVQIGDTTESQKDMDDWLDPTGSSSVKALLEADRTLGGKVDDLFVQSVSAPRRLATPDKPNGQLLMAEWTVSLIVTTT